jgi:PPOX class probable F420-dependent enzyme
VESYLTGLRDDQPGNMCRVATQLPDIAKKLLDSTTFAVISTINSDGSPQSSVIWVKRDGDDILFATVRGRRKTRNMERDPRVSLVAYDPDNPYQYFEVRGTVTLTDEGGRELINDLSLKYRGGPYPVEPPDVVRVVCRLTPQRAYGHPGS